MDTKKLRQKILDLAIRGKLVPQNPNDEPASVLIEKIRIEKEKLIKEKKIKRDKNESYIYRSDKSYYEKFTDGTVKCIDEEIPFEIPESWEWCRWRNIFQINPKNNIEDNLEVSFVPMTYIKDGYSNEAKFDIKQWKDIKSGFTHFQNNDLGIAKITPCFENRKSVIFVNLHNDHGAGTTELHIFRPFVFPLLSQYALYIAKSEYFISNGVANFSGAVGQQRVGKDIIGDYLIALPPLEEMSKVLSTVSELFLIVDDIEKDKLQLSICIKNFKSKILDLAIRGKLVPQDSNDEPASILLERIKAEHPESKKKALKTSDNSHYAFNIPKSWIWCDICDVCDVSPKNKIDDEVAVSFIPMTLISEGFSNKHSSETRKWGKVKKGFTHFRDGDVGIAKITPCFENRKSVVFKHLENQYGAGTTELHILRPISKYLSSAYILWFVKTDSFITNGISCFTGAVGQQRVGSSFVKETDFPLPPANEQKRIVKKIEKIFISLDKIENSIKA